MKAYQTVVVGTDGSESSLRAVDRAGAIAAESNAKLIIATGYFPHKDDVRAVDALGDEAYKVHGNAPIYAMLREARDRAKAAGDKDIEERAIEDAPVHALVELARRLPPICWWSAMWDWTPAPRSSGGFFRSPEASPPRPRPTY